MKKIILTLLMVVGLFCSSQSQEISKNAIGLRLGNNDGFGGEISYQRGLSSNNRLEFDLGWRNSKSISAFKLVGLYQWVWEIDNGFNWYAGIGGGIGSWSNTNVSPKESGTIPFAAGDIGLEYSFKEVPIQLSLDLRPELYFSSGGYRDSNFGSDLALGIRYKFD